MVAKVVAWSFSFAEASDKIDFLYFKTRSSEKTHLATKKALKNYKNEISVKGIYDPMVVQAVVEEARKNKIVLLKTSQFAYLELDGVEQNAETLVQNAPCKAFMILKGEKKPDKIKHILFITTGHVHALWKISLKAPSYNVSFLMKSFSLGLKNYDQKFFNNMWTNCTYGANNLIFIGATLALISFHLTLYLIYRNDLYFKQIIFNDQFIYLQLTLNFKL
jgi:hypothetical protein